MMNTHAGREQKNKSQSVANAISQKQSGGESTFQFVDNRPEAIAQRKLQEIANNSAQAKQTAQLRRIAENKSLIIQRINSAVLALTNHATVARAPTGMSANRFSDAGTSIHQVSLTDFPAGGGTIVDGNDSGARVDKQGNFDDGGINWANIQLQANRTNGGADYTDLTYPQGTAANQRGTSFAEVHIDNRIVASEKEDVLNRGKRLRISYF